MPPSFSLVHQFPHNKTIYGYKLRAQALQEASHEVCDERDCGDILSHPQGSSSCSLRVHYVTRSAHCEMLGSRVRDFPSKKPTLGCVSNIGPRFLATRPPRLMEKRSSWIVTQVRTVFWVDGRSSRFTWGPRYLELTDCTTTLIGACGGNATLGRAILSSHSGRLAGRHSPSYQHKPRYNSRQLSLVSISGMEIPDSPASRTSLVSCIASKPANPSGTIRDALRVPGLEGG